MIVVPCQTPVLRHTRLHSLVVLPLTTPVPNAIIPILFDPILIVKSIEKTYIRLSDVGFTS